MIVFSFIFALAKFLDMKATGSHEGAAAARFCREGTRRRRRRSCEAGAAPLPAQAPLLQTPLRISRCTSPTCTQGADGWNYTNKTVLAFV